MEMFLRKFLLFILLLLPVLAKAQGVQYTRKEAGDGGTGVPYPLVTVCTSGAAYTPLPCTPKASIYSDALLSTPLANPFRGDVFGNIEFYAAAGTYVVSITAPYSPGYSFKVVLGNASISNIQFATASTAGADWCAKVTTADASLGAAAGEIWVDQTAIPGTCASMFTLTAQHRLRFIQGGAYLVSNTLTVPTGGSLYAVGGGPGESSQVLTNSVTIQAISGTFPTSTAVVRYHNVAHSSLDGVNVDCQNISGCIGILYDSDNAPPSSLNTFNNVVVKGAHLGFVCQDSGTGASSNQSDSWKLTNFLIYGNAADTMGEGIHLNSSNCNSFEIDNGNIQSVNIALHQVRTNGIGLIKLVNAGSPVGTTPAFLRFDAGVAQVPDLIDDECEGGGWTGGCLVDASSNGTPGSPTIIGAQLDGNNSTFSGNDHITDIGSNQSSSSTFNCTGATAHVIAINTSKWAASGGCELSTWNGGVLQTQQASVTNANGVQYCTGSFATCAKVKNDAAGGISLLTNGGAQATLQNGGVLALPAGINGTEAACQGLNAGIDETCYDSVTHFAKLSNNGGSFFNYAQDIVATSAALATATTAGTCVQNTTAVAGSTTSMAVVASPVSTPGVGAVWSAFVSTNGTVTITECAVAASAGGSIAFNIRVIP